MGFGMRARSPARRWALTPPFHPCPFGRSIFCATFRGSLRAAVNGHPALWSPDFPLRIAKRSSSALSASRIVTGAGPGAQKRLGEFAAAFFGNRFGQPRQHVGRSAAETDVAITRDLRFVEIDLDQHAAALLHLERKAG